jgi:two-component system cell cycle sensor histidine kinase/response regulator CckA
MALQVVAEQPGGIDLVITDVQMPHVDGPELVRRLRRVRPELAVIYMSGLEHRELVGPGTVVLPKPFRAHQLIAAVAAALRADATVG